MLLREVQVLDAKALASSVDRPGLASVASGAVDWRSVLLQAANASSVAGIAARMRERGERRIVGCLVRQE
jgi:hypothetical protein